MSFNKQRIAVLGSTGSIGKSTLKVVSEYKKNFDLVLLVCNKNYKTIFKQINKFKPKFVYIHNAQIRYLIKSKFKKNIIFINNYQELVNKFSLLPKLDKVVLGLSSFEGLDYAFDFLKFSKEILIANKESLICGGRVLLKKSNYYNCKIIPIDSEHYCLSKLINNQNFKNIDTVYLTASGGPFLEKNKNIYAKSSIKNVVNHPNWSMGPKISVDSATMVNKIFEVIEAHILFNIPFNKIKIKIHKQSTVHSAVVFDNGLVNILAHDTSMIVPIRNSLIKNNFINQKSNFFKTNKNLIFEFNEQKLINFEIVKFSCKVYKSGHPGWILFLLFNDFLVNKFLNKEIFFYQICENLIKMFSNKSISFYLKKKIKNINDIKKLIKQGNNLLKNIYK